jgi:hypothetical protein
MASPKLGASQTANGTSENIQSEDRKPKLKHLYFANYSNIQAVAFDSFKDLTAGDCYRVMEELAVHLHKYRGPLDDGGASFEKWANRIAAKETSRYRLLALATTEYASVIHKAIHDHLWLSTVMDCGVGHDDVFNEVLWLIFQKAPALSRKGTAKLSTRLYALTKKHVFLYHNSKNTKRLKAVTKHLERCGEFGVEVMSEAELAAERAALSNPYQFESDGQFIS